VVAPPGAAAGDAQMRLVMRLVMAVLRLIPAAPDKSAKQESSRGFSLFNCNFINYVVITYIILAVTNLYIDSVRVIN
jgi:hypothetical protein